MNFSNFYLKEECKNSSFLILEGGSFGHLSHIWESDLTKDQLKDLIQKLISGEVKNIFEKTDGMNLLISYKNKEIVFSRNKQQLQNPLSLDQFKTFFADNLPNVSNTFMTAAEDLITAIKTIPEKELVDIFHEGKNFVSLEIINKNTINVIDYFQNLLIPHMLIKYNDGLITSYDRQIASNLFKRLPEKLKHYNIKVLEPLLINIPNYDDTKDKLLEQYLNELESTENIESLFLRLGTDVLKYIKKDLITINLEASIKEIKDRLKEQILTIKESGNEKELEKLNKQLSRFEICGGYKNIVGLEGIVFSYKDKILKLTGSFGPVNSILGMRKYDNKI